MFDTTITVVGTALTAPTIKQIEKTGAVVSSFRVVSNARRYDREKGIWVDGASLRVRVHCWRRLGEHVERSIAVGDPVIVHGRITTREWTSEEGEKRISYEIDADAVGHDLSRGTAVFTRSKPVTSVVEDDDLENRVNGEIAHDLSATGGEETQVEEAFDDFSYGDATYSGPIDDDAASILRAGLDPRTPEDEEQTEDDTETELVGAAPGGRGRRRR